MKNSIKALLEQLAEEEAADMFDPPTLVPPVASPQPAKPKVGGAVPPTGTTDPSSSSGLPGDDNTGVDGDVSSSGDSDLSGVDSEDKEEEKDEIEKKTEDLETTIDKTKDVPSALKLAKQVLQDIQGLPPDVKKEKLTKFITTLQTKSKENTTASNVLRRLGQFTKA